MCETEDGLVRFDESVLSRALFDRDAAAIAAELRAIYELEVDDETAADLASAWRFTAHARIGPYGGASAAPWCKSRLAQWGLLPAAGCLECEIRLTVELHCFPIYFAEKTPAADEASVPTKHLGYARSRIARTSQRIAPINLLAMVVSDWQEQQRRDERLLGPPARSPL